MLAWFGASDGGHVMVFYLETTSHRSPRGCITGNTTDILPRGEPGDVLASPTSNQVPRVFMLQKPS